MAIAGVFSDARAQRQPDLDPQKVVAHTDFSRILVQPEEVEGRVNLFPDWQQGVIFLAQGRFAPDIPFNYDVLNHTLLVLVEDKEFALNPIAVDSIYITNSSQILINPIILDGVGSDLLLLRVYESLHLSLFRNTLAAVVIDRDNNTGAIAKFEYQRPDIQIDQEQMYLLLNKATNEIVEFQGKKKELKNWENGGQVLDFIKNQHLILKNEVDLIQAVQYYEQLTFGEH